MTELTTSSVLQIRNVDDLARVADMMAKSGYFRDAKDAAQAGVKIMAGQGWGIQPFDAITGIHVIQGKPAVGANLMAAKVKGSGKYDYRVREMNENTCRIEFLQKDGDTWENIGVSEFTLEDAKKAGTQNLNKFPRNMLFARAMSNGVKWFTPDVFTSPVYVPEELGANVNADGDIIDTTSTVRETPTPEPETETEVVEPTEDPITAQQVKAIAIALRESELNRAEGRRFVSFVISRTVESVKELTKREAGVFLDAIADAEAEKFSVDAGKLADLLNAFIEEEQSDNN